jgi:hypothetical protein
MARFKTDNKEDAGHAVGIALVSLGFSVMLIGPVPGQEASLFGIWS